MRLAARLIVAGLATLACQGFANADTDQSRPLDGPGNSPQSELAPASPPEPVLAPIDRYRVIVERPLFTVDRRPSLSETSQLAQSNSFALTLTGIIVEGHERQAVFRHREQPRPVRLSVGATQQGWELLRIEDDHVILQKGTRSLRLTLDYGRPSAIAPAPDGEAGNKAEETTKTD